MSGYRQWIGRLYLARSGVHGPVAALLALPALGAGRVSGLYDFSKCSAFGGCGAAGLAPVAVRRNVFLPTFLSLISSSERLSGSGAGRGGRSGDPGPRLLRLKSAVRARRPRNLRESREATEEVSECSRKRRK